MSDHAKEIKIRVEPDMHEVTVMAEPVVIEGMTFWLHNSIFEGTPNPSSWTLSEERTGLFIAVAASAKLLLAVATAKIKDAGGPEAVNARIEKQLGALKAKGVEIW